MFSSNSKPKLSRSNIKDSMVFLRNSESRVIKTESKNEKFPARRSFSEYENDLLIVKFEMKNYIESLNSIFDYFINEDNDWLNRFNQFLGRKKIIDIYDYIPQCKEIQGRYLLMHTKFWVLYINYVTAREKLRLDKLSVIFNEAFKFDLDDHDLMYRFFFDMVSKFDKNEIYFCIIKNQISPEKFPKSFHEINQDHFKYILNNPENIVEWELNKIVKSGDKKKMFRPRSTDKSLNKKLNQETKLNKHLISIPEETLLMTTKKEKNFINNRGRYSEKEIALITASFLTEDDIKQTEIFVELCKENIELNEINRKITHINLEIIKDNQSKAKFYNNSNMYSVDAVNNFQIKNTFDKENKATQTFFIETEGNSITMRRKHNRFYSTAKK